MDAKTGSANHSVVFGSLVMLVLIAVGISVLHLSVMTNNILIFAIAFIMSGLVVAQYMGLRFEGRLVVWAFVLPLILFVILVIAMMPDIGHVSVPFGANPK